MLILLALQGVEGFGFVTPKLGSTTRPRENVSRVPFSESPITSIGSSSIKPSNFRYGSRKSPTCAFAVNNDEDDKKKKKKKNPYGDIDYSNIELEFVDYNDPEYRLDQDMDFEVAEQELDADEATLEMWREERRKRNDEFQFETYFQNVWSSGSAEYLGEWTTYGTTTFIPGLGEPTDEGDNFSYPSLVKARRTSKVISSASRHLVNPEAQWRGDRDIIRHFEYEVSNEAAEASLASRRDVDIDGGFGRHTDDESDSKSDSNTNSRLMLDVRYWPEEMKSFDFRGHQGNMCVGAAYTICDGVPLIASPNEDDNHDGPFKEKRIEIGIQGDDLRMRVKFYYKIKDSEICDPLNPPPLHLCTVTVCRERRGEWPCTIRDVNLFGPSGAKGGLYDPPPLGGDVQASRYMGLDLEGGASIFFPHAMEQTINAFGDDSQFKKYGWVLSLDWTPSGQRYQVDRKFWGGPKSKGLRSLELSEVQALDAETYRPRQGPADMRQ